MSDFSSRLTSGCLEAILSGQTVNSPVVQVLSFKIMPNQGGGDRYRLLLSDGIHSFSYAMLASQGNHLISSNTLTNFSIIQINNYACNVVSPEKRVIVVYDCSVLVNGEVVGTRLGNPTPFKADPNAPTDSVNRSSAPAPTSNNPPLTNSNRPNLVQGSPAPYGNKASPAPLSNRINTIDTLTPYQNRWRIRARVTGKTAIRNWNNSRGQGKLFSFNLIDESGEIRATGFNDAVDKFYEMLEINKVYYISKASLKTANKQYTSITNDYEMTLNHDTVIEPCDEEVNEVPQLSFNFVKINEMDNHQPTTIIDVIGVVKMCADVTSITGRQSGKEFQKRDLTIVDQSGMGIGLTLWGEEANNFEGKNFPVVAIKGAKISDFGGRSISTLTSSQLLINPDIREAHMLRSWYDREGSNLDFGSFRTDGAGPGGFSTNWKYLGEVKTDGLGGGEKPDYFTTKASILFIRKENCMYMACPQENCNKKVVDQGTNMYRCEKCQQEFSSFKWRMLLSVNLGDFTDTHWATCFQESAESILGINADELGNLKEKDEIAFDQIFNEATFKSFIFKLRIKMETFNDEPRMKAIVMSATPVDYVSYGNKILQDIQQCV